MKKWNMLFSFLGLFFILSGTLLCFKDGLKLDWWNIRYIMAGSLGVSCFAVFIYQKRNSAIYGLLVSVLGLGLAIIINRKVFEQEYTNIYNQVVGLINEHYLTNFEYIETTPPHAGFYYFILALALFLGLWLGIWCVLGKLKFISLLPVPISVTAGLLLSYPPSVGAVILLLCGSGFLYGKKREGEQGALVQGRTLVLFCMATAALISLSLLKPVSGKLLGYYESFIQFQRSLEDKGIAFLEERGWDYFRYWQEDLSKVILSNDAPKLTDEDMFRVTVNKMPIDIIYMKKFTGGVYKDGSWEADTLEAAIEPQSTWRGHTTMDAGEETWMYVELIGENKNVVLSPSNIEYQGMWVKEYSEDYKKQATMEYTRLPEGNLERIRDAAQAFGMAEPGYEQWDYFESSYEETDVNLDGEEYIVEEFISKPFTVLTRYYEEELGEVTEFIQKDTYYSLNLNPVPTGKDFAEYFLFEQKKGFCVHYATTGTLLLRAMGIPARYVSGYIVMPSDFKKNEDGTFTAVVKKKRAHAWAEVLKSYEYYAGMLDDSVSIGMYRDGRSLLADGGGEGMKGHYWWETVELTPPAYTHTLRTGNPETPLTETVESVEQRMREERDAANPGDEAQTDLENGRDADETKNENSSPADTSSGSLAIEKAVKTISVIVAVILAFRVLLTLRRWFLLYKRKRRFLDEDSGKAVLHITRQTLRTLEALGYKKGMKMSEPDYGAYIQRNISCFSEDEFPKFISIARLNAYSNETITECQRSDMYKAYEKLLKYIKVEARVSSRKMFYWKYILVLF